MAEHIELEVATPERELVRVQVDEVQVPGKDGYLGILPGHAPLLGQLGTGALSYHSAGRRHYLAIQGGFLEVLPDHVRVLANLAERSDEIELGKAKADLQRALEQASRQDASIDPKAALDAMALAQARVDAAEKA